MNAGYYMVVFDEATFPWTALCGIDARYRQANQRSTYSIEGHITWDRELLLLDPLEIRAQLLGFDDKKIHGFMWLRHAEKGYVAATHEILSMHIDSSKRRSTPFPAQILDRLGELQIKHRRLERPEKVGRRIRVKEHFARF